jgi:hypothetical protein
MCVVKMSMCKTILWRHTFTLGLFNDHNSDCVGALLLAGADETITNDNGQTPVQWAVKWDSVKVLSLLDVSSKWKLLVRSHRLRRRTAVRVMMTLVKWKVQQTRSMWTRAIMKFHTTMVLVEVQQSKLLQSKLLQAALEGRIDDVSQLSTRFAGDVDTLSEALYNASKLAQLNVVT